MRLGDLTWRRAETGSLVLVPVGSLEQHGPHLPLNTDSVIATAVAEGMARALASSRTVAVAPAVPFGASGEHQEFPGTVSIGTEALALVLVELARSLGTWAAGVVFVNGHGGNLDAFGAAVEVIRAEGMAATWVPCAVPDGDAHAGRTETSLMLHLGPDTVELGVAAAGATEPIGRLLPALRAAGVRAVAPNGVLGDPAGASAAEGERLLASMISGALARLEPTLAAGAR
ncbi:mycofactocin biosynthesis peptidyl-dipeptidase MftE [Leifsonia sp. NPDC080035]|uniref:Mycofactocin biosynthesis peptidyl-dipeptidase MftE n=1 Tax=Leifsonia sp. NPDC080035 TaxID=3143936 RepID=A0AAU7GA80_9MICO